MKETIIRAEIADKGIRYDQFLAKKLALSRSIAARLIKIGHAKTETAFYGSTIKPAQLIVGHEIFFIKNEEVSPSIITPQAINLDIVYSDEHIAVINKPTNLVVHPGAGVKDGTLCNALLHHFPEMNIGKTVRPGIVHRLDKDTSGLMVVAKTDAAHQILSDDFKNRRVKKAYRAYCFGDIKTTSFELKTGHMRNPHNRLKFLTNICEPKLPRAGCRSAHTSFVVLNSSFGITELTAILHTGRTHQIRAHLADIGNPLLGDFLYGASSRTLSKTCPQNLQSLISELRGQALHAEVLKFSHPITKIFLEFTAPLPEPLLSISRYF